MASKPEDKNESGFFMFLLATCKSYYKMYIKFEKGSSFQSQGTLFTRKAYW